MPAWGGGPPEDEADTRELFRFMRHPPDPTRKELVAMRPQNPRSPAETGREREAERFLAGGEPAEEITKRRRPE